MNRQVSEESPALFQEIEDENLSGPEEGGKDTEWPSVTLKIQVTTCLIIFLLLSDQKLPHCRGIFSVLMAVSSAKLFLCSQFKPVVLLCSLLCLYFSLDFLGLCCFEYLLSVLSTWLKGRVVFWKFDILIFFLLRVQ